MPSSYPTPLKFPEEPTPAAHRELPTTLAVRCAPHTEASGTYHFEAVPGGSYLYKRGHFGLVRVSKGWSLIRHGKVLGSVSTTSPLPPRDGWENVTLTADQYKIDLRLVVEGCVLQSTGALPGGAGYQMRSMSSGKTYIVRHRPAERQVINELAVNQTYRLFNVAAPRAWREAPNQRVWIVQEHIDGTPLKELQGKPEFDRVRKAAWPGAALDMLFANPCAEGADIIIDADEIAWRVDKPSVLGFTSQGGRSAGWGDPGRIDEHDTFRRTAVFKGLSDESLLQQFTRIQDTPGVFDHFAPDDKQTLKMRLHRFLELLRRAVGDPERLQRELGVSTEDATSALRNGKLALARSKLAPVHWGEGVVWQCLCEGGQWRTYSEENNKVLEVNYLAASKVEGVMMAFQPGNQPVPYTLDFDRMVQVNERTRAERPLARGFPQDSAQRSARQVQQMHEPAQSSSDELPRAWPMQPESGHPPAPVCWPQQQPCHADPHAPQHRGPPPAHGGFERDQPTPVRDRHAEQPMADRRDPPHDAPPAPCQQWPLHDDRRQSPQHDDRRQRDVSGCPARQPDPPHYQPMRPQPMHEPHPDQHRDPGYGCGQPLMHPQSGRDHFGYGHTDDLAHLHDPLGHCRRPPDQSSQSDASARGQVDWDQGSGLSCRMSSAGTAQTPSRFGSSGTGVYWECLITESAKMQRYAPEDAYQLERYWQEGNHQELLRGVRFSFNKEHLYNIDLSDHDSLKQINAHTTQIRMIFRRDPTQPS
eukprot:TRINITY_DN1836_c0_g1_i1.p1 TRINITY_DN1836_c0_g1~~TRINITY_DN1836_c0_g1_i1.p1  ORF type:complete len:777 (+),score=83.54 TRINITY_DN1836_c0_g1_i1:58-2331(+)